MRFGADDDFFGLSFEELFTDREEQQKRWKELLSAKAGEPLPVQFYYGVSGEGKSYLRRQFKKLSADKSGIPTLVLDLERMGYGKEGPDSAALVLRLVSEIQMAAPRVQLAALFIAMEEAKSLVDGKALAEDLAVNAVSAGADAFMQSFQGKFEGIGVGSFLSAIAKTGWQTYQKSKEPLQEYLRTGEGQADLARLRAMEMPEDIKRTMFRRFGRDLQDHEQPMAGNRAAKAVLLVDTLEADSVGSIRPTEAKNHTWIGDLYAACNEAKDGSQPRLLIAAFGRSKVSHDIPEDHCEERLLGGIPEADAKDYLIGRRKVPAELVPEMIEEARIGSEPFCHAFSLGLLGDSYALNNDLPAVEEGWKHLPKEEALAQRFLKQIREGETGDSRYLARLALTPVWDREAAAFTFGVAEDPEKAQDKLDWLMSFSFVQPAKFPQTEVHGFTLHSIMRKALTETSPERDTVRRHRDWIDFWQSKSEKDLDFPNRASWSHRYCLRPLATYQDWAVAAREARTRMKMDKHLTLVQMAQAWLTERPRNNEGFKTMIWADWQVGWATEAQQVTIGDITSLALASVSAYRHALEVYVEDSLTAKWAGTQNNLGIVLQVLGQRSGSVERLLESVSAYRSALQVFTKESEPTDWAMTQNNLGAVLQSLGDILGSDQRLQESILAYQSALEVYTKDYLPVDWAMIQNNLGAVLGVLGKRSGSNEKLQESVDSFRRALEIRTKDDLPEDWAATQNNLGNVLQILGMRFASDENLMESVSAYRSALQVRTKDYLPADWAMTQNNLGALLYALGLKSGSKEKLQESVSAYRCALEVRTKDSLPAQWAATQNNLGTVLQVLGEKSNSDEKLLESVCAYRSALEVRTKELMPVDWAMTQNNLGIALQVLGQRSGSDEKLLESVSAYRSALEVRTKEALPAQWARTLWGLAYSLRVLAGLKKDPAIALEALRAANESFGWYSCSSLNEYIAPVRNLRNVSLKLCRELGAELTPEMQELLNTIEAEEAASDNSPPDAP